MGKVNRKINEKKGEANEVIKTKGKKKSKQITGANK